MRSMIQNRFLDICIMLLIKNEKWRTDRFLTVNPEKLWSIMHLFRLMLRWRWVKLIYSRNLFNILNQKIMGINRGSNQIESTIFLKVFILKRLYLIKILSIYNKARHLYIYMLPIASEMGGLIGLKFLWTLRVVL